MDSLQQLCIFFCWGSPLPPWAGASWGQSRERERDNHLPHTAESTVLIQNRIQLVFQDESIHCRLMSSFSFTRTPKVFYTGLFSICSSHSLYSFFFGNEKRPWWEAILWAVFQSCSSDALESFPFNVTVNVLIPEGKWHHMFVSYIEHIWPSVDWKEAFISKRSLSVRRYSRNLYSHRK